MAWTDPATITAMTPLTASFFNQQLRDNMAYLLAGFALSQVVHVGAADYVRTASTWANVDETNLSITASIVSGRALCVATFAAHVDNTSGSSGLFTFEMDSATRLGGDYGLARLGQNGSALITLVGLFTGVGVGSHTFRLQYRNLQSGAAVTIRNNNYPVTMLVWGL